MDRAKLWKRGAGVAVAGGFALAASGCFLPDTGQLRVVVGEQFSTDGPPSFTFDQETYYAPRGEIDVDYIGPAGSPVPHDLKIEGQDSAFVFLPTDLDEVEGDVDLEAGTYVLFCSLTGHRGLGMEASLVVL
jgi:hypothetical protein